MACHLLVGLSGKKLGNKKRAKNANKQRIVDFQKANTPKILRNSVYIYIYIYHISFPAITCNPRMQLPAVQPIVVCEK